MSTASPPTKELKRYEEVVARVVHLIDHGTFGAGDRVPSVREMAGQMKVSITTVLQAYRMLENQGYIEARPQSGYYVQTRLRMKLEEPGPAKTKIAPCAVNIPTLALCIMKDARLPNMVQLGTAIPHPEDVPTEKLNRALAAMGRRHRIMSNSYDMPPGCEMLRVQVAQRALHSGCSLTPDEIVTTCGAQEAIYLALRATCQPGDVVAIESPSFFGTLQTIESLGLRAIEIPTHPRTGASLPALAQAIEKFKVAAVIVITNFNNPAGGMMSDEAKRQLVEMLAPRRIPLIEDDLYGDLCHGVKRPSTAKAHDREGLVLLCSSFSKTLAPGYRVGWIAPGRFQERVEQLKMVTNIATPMLTQLGVADFLANGGYDHHLRRIRRVYQKNCALVSQTVAEHFPSGTRVTSPEGGFIVWVELPGSIDTVALYEQAKANRISFAPGPLFSPTRGFRNFLRLSAARITKREQDAIATIGRLAGEMLRK